MAPPRDLTRLSVDVRGDPELFEHVVQPWRGFYGLLLQDIRQSAFPIGGYRRRDRAPALVLHPPPDDATDRMIAAAFRSPGEPTWGRPDLSRELCEWATRFIHQVIVFGVAVYEIAHWTEAGETTPAAFQILPIHHLDVKPKGGRYEQSVPQGAIAFPAGTPITEAFTVELPRERVLYVKLPRRFSRLAPALRLLGRLENRGAGVMLGSLEGPSPFPVDSSVLHNEAYAAAELLGWTGWDIRGRNAERETAYFSIARSLRFESFCQDLRALALEAMNSAIGMAGTELGFSTRACGSGLPTRDDLKRAVQRLEAGDTSQKEVLAGFSFY